VCGSCFSSLKNAILNWCRINSNCTHTHTHTHTCTAMHTCASHMDTVTWWFNFHNEANLSHLWIIFTPLQPKINSSIYTYCYILLLFNQPIFPQICRYVLLSRSFCRLGVFPVKLEFHGSSFPRSILMTSSRRMSLTSHEEIGHVGRVGWGSPRGCP